MEVFIKVSTARHVAPWVARKSSAPFPFSIAMVLSAPAATQAGAVTLIDAHELTGQPLRGSRMWQ